VTPFFLLFFCLYSYDVPTDALHDPEILKDYLWRLQLLGWTNRTDFEESWMALLAVIGGCVSASGGGGAGSGDATSGMFPEGAPSPAEAAVLARAGALGIAGLAGLLRQTMLLPFPGFSFASHSSRFVLHLGPVVVIDYGCEDGRFLVFATY
jgi:hypothetical protein